MQLQQITTYPKELLTCAPTELHHIFPQPTLLHLPGKHPEPLFVSVLLHGNETTGFLAIQNLLNKYAEQTLPRALSLFFGNTLAAQHSLRRLDKQPDYNRIWPSTELAHCPEMLFANEIVAVMRNKQVFASVDIHNNTGLNPHYACINKLDNTYLQLANLFGRLVVYFLRPVGVQSSAFAELCPAVTLECGRPGIQNGTEHAFTYLDACLHLTELATHPVYPQDIDVFHTTAQVKVKPGVSFSFHDTQADLLFDQNLERMNFTEIAAETCFGFVQGNTDIPVQAINEQGKDITHQFFKLQQKQLQIKRTTMPSMLTLDERVIQQDCLCYLMERIVV
ncbi:MAG: succinylglutamate desuccinylase [Methyloprofundus sp.]|nr:MAG: succinylglutamate desuccinylase [Methyloprofundus sp.]